MAKNKIIEEPQSVSRFDLLRNKVRLFPNFHKDYQNAIAFLHESGALDLIMESFRTNASFTNKDFDAAMLAYLSGMNDTVQKIYNLFRLLDDPLDAPVIEPTFGAQDNFDLNTR